MVDENLASALHLSADCDEDEVSSAIVALLTSAVHDSEPRKTLSEIYQFITNSGATAYLDPLNTLPLLLACDDSAARDIISVISECSPGKEVVMAVQEAVERLERSLEDEDDEDEDENEDQKVTKEAKKIPQNSLLNQLVTLIDVYASAIPRMKLRRKSASDTLRPLSGELEAVIGLASGRASRSEGLSLLSSIARLAKRVGRWVDSVAVNAQGDAQACKAVLKNLLGSSLLACERFIQVNIAQRTLEQCFPRLAARSKLDSDWVEGEEVISQLLDVYGSLGLYTGKINGPCMASDLVFCAYQTPTEIDPDKLLSFLLPALISSIQANSFLDQSLAILIKGLHTRLTSETACDLPEDIAVPLYSLLPSVASVHPDPPIRYQAFRVLSLLLSSESQQLRFHHLVELTGDSEYPQMRVASVGLVKESLLQALSRPKGNENMFLGPLFLRTFGPILFKPDPPDLFSSALTLKNFQETHEPARLAECLSLYYVLLQRDELNSTGIRDKDIIKSVENSLLASLRHHLKRWMDDPSFSQSHLHDITAVVSLKISLERIDTAIASLE